MYRSGCVSPSVLALRIVWRVGPGRRLPSAASGITEFAAELVHYALYALLVCVVVLGFCFRWSQHVPLSFFGWFVVPAPYPFGEDQEQLMDNLHYWAATAAVILASGHAGAALFHQYVLHDDLLRRMLPARSARKG